jgi:hypothetical protein
MSLPCVPVLFLTRSSVYGLYASIISCETHPSADTHTSTAVPASQSTPAVEQRDEHARMSNTASNRFSNDNVRPSQAQRFKDAFCHRDVHIHFVGVWCVYQTHDIRLMIKLTFGFRDSVSSIGITRGKPLPGTLSPEQYTCNFRHALAADERRVKFLPEYANGGMSKMPHQTQADALSGHGNERLFPRVKEVWFRGTHSDMYACVVAW